MPDLNTDARAAIVRLSQRDNGVTADELAADLGCHRTRAATALRVARLDGVVLMAPRREGQRGRPPHVYTYAPLPAGPTHRPVHDTPRLEHVRQAPRGSAPHKRHRAGRKDVRAQIARIEAQGGSVQVTGSGHLLVRGPKGTATIPSTGGAGNRSAQNSRADLRRAGLDV